MIEKLEIEFGKYLAQVEITYKEVDASFDHAFGTEFLSELEIEDIAILSAEDPDGKEVLLTKDERDKIEQLAVDKFYN